jgi:hypothetical protein
MSYKNKYLKYKQKYLNLLQNGSGRESYRILDRRVLENISTGESPEDRMARINRNELPPDGYKIMENINEILELNYNLNFNTLDPSIRQQRIQYIEQVTQNLNKLFNDAFSIIQLYGCRLLYIDARGDGNCFLNSLYIYTLSTNKNDKINELYSLTGILESNLINFNDFKKSLEFLGETLLDSQINSFGYDIVQIMKQELRDPNIPSVQVFAQLYCDHFNVTITVIQVNKDFQFLQKTTINPSNPNEQTDTAIIIQKGNAHFGLLIPIAPPELNYMIFDIRKYLDTLIVNT